MSDNIDEKLRPILEDVFSSAMRPIPDNLKSSHAIDRIKQVVRESLPREKRIKSIDGKTTYDNGLDPGYNQAIREMEKRWE